MFVQGCDNIGAKMTPRKKHQGCDNIGAKLTSIKKFRVFRDAAIG
jgi:hypothetical protein